MENLHHASYDVLPPEIVALILQHLSFSELATLLKYEPQFSQLISNNNLLEAFTKTFDYQMEKNTSRMEEETSQPNWIFTRGLKRKIPLPKEHVHQLKIVKNLLLQSKDSNNYEKHLKKFHYHRIQILMSAWKYNLKTEIRYSGPGGCVNCLIYFEQFVTWLFDYDIQTSTRVRYQILIGLPIEFCGSIFWNLRDPTIYPILQSPNIERFCKVLPKYFYLFLKLIHPRYFDRFPSWRHSARLATIIEKYSDEILRIPNGVSLFYFVSMFERVDPRKILSKCTSVSNSELLMEKLDEFEFPLKYLWSA